MRSKKKIRTGDCPPFFDINTVFADTKDMTAVFLSASAVMLIIFLFSLPFDIKSHTALSLGRFFVVENLHLFGVVTFAFSFKIENGRIFYNGKPLKKKQKNEKKNQKPKQEKSLFDNLNIVSAEVRGSFGNASDAASTAMVSSLIITIFELIKNTNILKTQKFAINFIPIYQRNIFDFDLKIRIRVNVFIILFMFLKILRKR